MAKGYLPNPVAAMAEPRFTPPQQDFSSVFQGALQSLTGVADNYRRKQMSVQSAERMAGLLEAEGLGSEANAYRQAAQAYDINFFSTPDQNEQFNRSILSDSLKLLAAKQDRDIRKNAQDVQNRYYEGLIQNRTATAGQRSEESIARQEDRDLRASETRRRNQASILGSRMDDLRAEANQLQTQLDHIVTSTKTGNLDLDAARTQAASIKARQKQIGEEYNQLNANLRAVMSADEQGNSQEQPVSQFNRFFTPDDPVSGITPTPKLKEDEVQNNADILTSNPNLSRAGTVSAQRPGTIRVEQGPLGTKTTTTTPIGETVKGIDPYDPLKSSNPGPGFLSK